MVFRSGTEHIGTAAEDESLAKLHFDGTSLFFFKQDKIEIDTLPTLAQSSPKAPVDIHDKG